MGISKQAFLAMGTYLFVILFRSSGLFLAAGTVIGVLLVQGIAYLILPLLCRRMKGLLLSFSAVLFTALCAVCIQYLFAFLPVNGLTVDALPLPGPTYLLILVPLLMDQAKNSEKHSSRSSIRLAALFVLMILPVAFLREILGFGTLCGIQMMSADLVLLPLLSNIAGAAFLECILMSVILLIYRRVTGKTLVLAVIGETNPQSAQPVLIRSEELTRLQAALISLLILLLSSSALICLSTVVFAGLFDFCVLLLIAVLLQGGFAGLIYLSLGKKRTILGDELARPWILPVQIMMIMLPFTNPIADLVDRKGILIVLLGVLLYLVCSWVLAVIFLLFRRSLRRKLLFGRRPDILSGLPFLLLLVALCLVVLAGFGSIPQTILTRMVSLS